MRRLSWLATFATVLGAAPTASASYPAALRARPLRVTAIPASDLPPGIAGVRLEGVFAFPDWPISAGGPAAPSCGVLDLWCAADSRFCSGPQERCNSGCAAEWAEIAESARKGECIAVPLRLLESALSAVRPLGSGYRASNPYDPVMGTVVVPCQPENPGPTRPDLTIACAVAARAGEGDAASRPPADPPAGAATDAAVLVTDAGASPSAGRPKLGERGCAFGGSGPPAGAAFAALALLAIALRRRW